VGTQLRKEEMMESRSLRSTSQVALLILLLSLSGWAQVSAPQAGTSRLLGFGAAAVFSIVSPQTPKIYEVDPGSGIGTLLSGSQVLSSSWDVVTAYDPVGSRLFIYDTGSVRTVDAHTGAFLQSVPTPFLSTIKYEITTGRLLALTYPPANGNPQLVEVHPTTGAVTSIAALTGFGPTSLPATAAIDPATHRLFFYHTLPGISLTYKLAVIDTINGIVLSDTTLLPGMNPNAYLHYDGVTGQLFGWAEFAVGSASALETINPATGIATPIGAGHPTIIPGFGLGGASAIDEQRREFYLEGEYFAEAGGSIGIAHPNRLFTLNLDTGEMLSDPLLPTWYIALEVDLVSGPLRGRVTASPNMCLVPGVTRTLTFEALGHVGELYLPFVSCTPGSLPVGGGLVIPLAFDLCSNFYFNDPAATAFFALTPSGGFTDILPATEAVQGTVTLPPFTPAGLSFDLTITFLTFLPPLQWTGLHGQTTLHVRS